MNEFNTQVTSFYSKQLLVCVLCTNDTDIFVKKYQMVDTLLLSTLHYVAVYALWNVAVCLYDLLTHSFLLKSTFEITI